MTLKIEIRAELIKIGPPYKNIYIIYIADLIPQLQFENCEVLRYYSPANFVEFRYNNSVGVVADYVEKYICTQISRYGSAIN